MKFEDPISFWTFSKKWKQNSLKIEIGGSFLQILS
jgi:hypothetical protein